MFEIDEILNDSYDDYLEIILQEIGGMLNK